jgi:hypothetical protein
VTLSRTSLTGHAASMRDPSPEAARREAKRAFHDSEGKIILINTDWLTGWGDRQQAILLGEKLHGKRSAK